MNNQFQDQEVVKDRIENYLKRGNPPDFLRRLGILTPEGEINYPRAVEVLSFVAENEESIKNIITESGAKITERTEPPPSQETTGGIIVE